MSIGGVRWLLTVGFEIKVSRKNDLKMFELASTLLPQIPALAFIAVLTSGNFNIAAHDFPKLLQIVE